MMNDDLMELHRKAPHLNMRVLGIRQIRHRYHHRYRWGLPLDEQHQLKHIYEMFLRLLCRLRLSIAVEVPRLSAAIPNIRDKPQNYWTSHTGSKNEFKIKSKEIEAGCQVVHNLLA